MYFLCTFSLVFFFAFYKSVKACDGQTLLEDASRIKNNSLKVVRGDFSEIFPWIVEEDDKYKEPLAEFIVTEQLQ